MTQLIMGHGVSGHYGTSLAPCAIPSIASSFSRRVGMQDGHRTHPRETNSPDAHRPPEGLLFSEPMELHAEAHGIKQLLL